MGDVLGVGAVGGQNVKRHPHVVAGGAGEVGEDQLRHSDGIAGLAAQAVGHRARAPSSFKQAYNAAKDLKDNLIFNLCNISDDENSTEINYSVPFIFSTYQTMRNLLNDTEKNPYSIGHFDLIILDEAHRSIYNKYQDIFKYFDSMIVGLTATPKNEVGRNTYEIFDLENKTPTYGYELEQAVKDGYLVNYQVANYKLDILNRGIHYKI